MCNRAFGCLKRNPPICNQRLRTQNLSSLPDEEVGPVDVAISIEVPVDCHERVEGHIASVAGYICDEQIPAIFANECALDEPRKIAHPCSSHIEDSEHPVGRKDTIIDERDASPRQSGFKKRFSHRRKWSLWRNWLYIMACPIQRFTKTNI